MPAGAGQGSDKIGIVFEIDFLPLHAFQVFRQDLVDIVVKLCEICCTFLGTKDLADIGQLCAQNLRVPGADDDDLYPEGFQLLDGILPGGVAAGEEHFRARCGDRLPVGAVEIAGIRKARKFGEVVLVGGIFLGVGRLVDRHDRVAGAIARTISVWYQRSG